MRNSLKTTKITFVVLFIIALLIIGLATYVSLNGVSINKPKPTPTPTPTPTQAVVKTDGDTTCDAVIVSVSTEEKMIRIYEPESAKYIDLSYTGATDIRDRFEKVISATQLSACTIAEVSFDSESGKLYHLYLDDDYWFYENPPSWDMKLDKGMLTISSQNYRLAENVATFCEDGVYDVTQITDMDQINVYGKGQRVFAIMLVQGHGTLYVMNESEFVGGSFYVDNVYAGQITEGFKLVIREGKYEVSFSLGDLNGKETVTVSRNGTSVVDMKTYTEDKKEYGFVTFFVKPEGAQLFIDNYYYDTSEAVKLPYGTHYIEVMAQGYTSFGGSITVDSAAMSLQINLVLMTYSTPTPTPAEEPDVSPSPTEEPDVSPTPGPEAELTPTETPTPTPAPADNEKEITLSWYPSSVVIVDSVYVGTTDSAGSLKVVLTYGTHIIKLTRTAIDGTTQPKTYEVTVSGATSAYLSIPTE